MLSRKKISLLKKHGIKDTSSDGLMKFLEEHKYVIIKHESCFDVITHEPRHEIRAMRYDVRFPNYYTPSFYGDSMREAFVNLVAWLIERGFSLEEKYGRGRFSCSEKGKEEVKQDA